MEALLTVGGIALGWLLRVGYDAWVAPSFQAKSRATERREAQADKLYRLITNDISQELNELFGFLRILEGGGGNPSVQGLHTDPHNPTVKLEALIQEYRACVVVGDLQDQAAVVTYLHHLLDTTFLIAMRAGSIQQGGVLLDPTVLDMDVSTHAAKARELRLSALSELQAIFESRKSG